MAVWGPTGAAPGGGLLGYHEEEGPHHHQHVGNGLHHAWQTRGYRRRGDVLPVQQRAAGAALNN
eukprot:962827-Prorocentrum_minimum.AAC.1